MTASERAHAVDGRSLGKRGAQTRRRLLDATAELLESRGARELRVTDVARDVGMSPAAYYQYFRDVDDAVLVLAEEAGADALVVASRIQASWQEPGALAAIRALVDEWVDYWDDHRAVLRIRNLKAQEGDQQFRGTRRRANQPFIDGFADLVIGSQATGRVSEEISPTAAAVALVSLMERMAAFHVELEEMQVDRRALVETTARIIEQTVLGRSDA